MSKEQTTANKMADTAVVTEKQESKQDLRKQLEQAQQDNAKLRERLHVAEQNLDWISRYLDDRTAFRISDLRNLLKLLSVAKDNEIISTLLNVAHIILDEAEVDLDLIAENSIEELILRYHETEKEVLRGGWDV